MMAWMGPSPPCSSTIAPARPRSEAQAAAISQELVPEKRLLRRGCDLATEHHALISAPEYTR
eukprot:2179687-Rhodomonas_salina.2